MTTQIAIEAIIVSYIPNAMSDTVDNGIIVFDASVLQILSPASLKGTEMTLYHDVPVSEDSFWHDTNRRITFQIQESIFQRSDVLFTGAITTLEVGP